jgi:hypothetical protein
VTEPKSQLIDSCSRDERMKILDAVHGRIPFGHAGRAARQHRSRCEAVDFIVRLWDADTDNTLDVRLCKSLDDAIYSAGGAMSSHRAQRALSGKERAA